MGEDTGSKVGQDIREEGIDTAALVRFLLNKEGGQVAVIDNYGQPDENITIYKRRKSEGN